MKEMNQIFDEKSRLEGNGDLIYGGPPYREPVKAEDQKVSVFMALVIMGGIVAVITAVIVKKRKIIRNDESI